MKEHDADCMGAGKRMVRIESRRHLNQRNNVIKTEGAIKPDVPVLNSFPIFGVTYECSTPYQYKYENDA
jgi:hypothetical protein